MQDVFYLPFSNKAPGFLFCLFSFVFMCLFFFFLNQPLSDEFIWKLLVKPWAGSAEWSQVCIYYSPSFQGTSLHCNRAMIEQWYKTEGNESRLLVSKLLNVKLLFVSLRGFLKCKGRHQSNHARNCELFKACFSTVSWRCRATSDEVVPRMKLEVLLKLGKISSLKTRLFKYSLSSRPMIDSDPEESNKCA